MARDSSGSGVVIGIILGVVGLFVVLPVATCFLCCGGATFFGWQIEKKAKEELAEGNRQWDAGNKADAVIQYKALLDRNLVSVPSDAERPTVYQRIIEYEVERGDLAAARQFARRAWDEDVEVASDNKATKTLLAEERAKYDGENAELGDEYDVRGLVLLNNTLAADTSKATGEVTGTVVNRRSVRLNRVQITFNLYNANGALVGTATASINGLEAGGRWNFRAPSNGVAFETYKVKELSGN